MVNANHLVLGKDSVEERDRFFEMAGADRGPSGYVEDSSIVGVRL
jgi:hypothetical protein